MPPIPLWEPSERRIEACNLTRFGRSLGFEPPDYHAFHHWTVENRAEFWDHAWNYLGVIGNRTGEVLINGDDFLASRFFPQSTLNYAENMLRRHDDAPAILSLVESGPVQSLSFRELRRKAIQFAAELQDRGVKQGDRIAGYLPNVPETVVAMLGTSAIGAIWSSCSPDFGYQGALDRFGQISPKLLVSVDGYRYNGKEFTVEENARQLVQQISSVEDLLLLRQLNASPDDFDSIWKRPEFEIEFAELPFDHPLFIMYSSGTTGKPKCIVHGAGGTLLQHMKEHQLHVDLNPSSRLFFFTTCGWMMWNWLVTALASEATIVLYDGSPFHPRSNVLTNLIEALGITQFGAGAKYYSTLQKEQATPAASANLESLQTILSTGSPLLPESFDYVYSNIKSDVHLASISGGTDLISCFELGIPWLPVYKGEIQGPGLGMDVDVYDENANSIRGSKGELVCKKSFPSKPIGFWNDADDAKYRSAYFEVYPNTWAHRDFAERVPTTNGLIIYGRSDALLNPGGVRIGTAEIYRQVESMTEVSEALCIGQNWDGDTRIVLFVVLVHGIDLDAELTTKIKHRIRTNASPKHVPAVVLQVSDIPRTRSGKIAEIAVRDVVHGNEVPNTSALANPKSLDEFRCRQELVQHALASTGSKIQATRNSND